MLWLREDQNPKQTACSGKANESSDLTNIIVIEPKNVNRLPSYDYKYQRAEKVAFLALQIVALSLILFAVSDASRFSTKRDEICQALSSNLLANVKGPTLTAKEAPGTQVKTSQQTAGVPLRTPPRS